MKLATAAIVTLLVATAAANSLRWTPPEPIWPDTATGDSLWQLMPSLVGADSVVWAAWQQKRGEGPEVTCLARHDGRSWLAPDSVLPLAPEEQPYYLRLDLDREGNPWVVYDPYDPQSGTARLLCVRRVGDTWTHPEEIALETHGRSLVPGLGAHPKGGVQVTLIREEGLDIRLYTMRGTGDSWTAPLPIDSALAVMLPREQAVAAINDSQMMIVWPASRDAEHRPLWSMIGSGDTWSAPIPVVFPPAGTEMPPRIAVTQPGFVRLFWQRSGHGIQSARFDGARWVDTLQLDPEYSGGPSVCTDEYGWTWVSYYHYLESGYWRSFVRYNDGTGWSEPLEGFDTSFAIVDMAVARGRLWALLGRKQESSAGSLLYYSSARHPSALAESGESELPSGVRAGTTILRGALFLEGQGQRGEDGMVLLDAAGREAAVLVPGHNDLSRISPGVYFLREAVGETETGQYRRLAARKVVIQR